MRGTIDHVWENETEGGQKYLTVQMNGERYSVWDSNRSLKSQGWRVIRAWEHEVRDRPGAVLKRVTASLG